LPLRRIDKIRLIIATLALVVPLTAVAVLGVGVGLFQTGAVGLYDALIWLGVAAVIGFLGLVVLLAGRAAGWVGWLWLVILTLPAAAPIAVAAWAVTYLLEHPSTAEISTDLLDPPSLADPLAALPADAVAEVRLRHRDIATVTLALPPKEAFDLAVQVAQSRPGWTVIDTASPYAIHGTAVFGRFGYGRDWAIRVRPELGGGALVDLRLRSKPGEPDLGDNGLMVKGYLDALKAAEQ
jgi:hypothetical protein